MSNPSPGVQLLAKRLMEDIRRRNLSPSDRYLTSAEVGKLFDVSYVTAHRAMKLLADQNILVRQRKSGTFVGEGLASDMLSQRGRIHFIVSAAVGQNQAEIVDTISTDLLAGVIDVSPGVSIQFDIIHPEDGTDVIQSILQAGQQAGGIDGAVLVRASAAVQRQFDFGRFPTVVFGHLYPGISHLVGIDVDHRELGRLAARHIRDRQYKAVSFIMENIWSPGDSFFSSGLLQGVQEFRVKASIAYHTIPIDREGVRLALDDILRNLELPQLVIVRHPGLLKSLLLAANQLGINTANELPIAMGNYFESNVGGQPIPGGRAGLSRREMGHLIGSMLKKQRFQEPIEERQIIIPVTFHDGESDIAT